MKEKKDIEAILYWALNEQGLGWGGGDAMSNDMATLGTRIDKSVSYGMPPPGLGRNDNGDAGVVRGAIDKLPPDVGALVLANCRIGCRPDWGEEGFGTPAQVTNRRGQGQWIYRDQKNRRGKIGPVLDWPAYAAHVAQIEFERGQWFVWWEGMAVLAEMLHGELETYEPTRPRVKHQPWVGLPDDGPVLIPTGFTTSDKRREINAPNERATDWSIPLPPVDKQDDKAKAKKGG